MDTLKNKINEAYSTLFESKSESVLKAFGKLGGEPLQQLGKKLSDDIGKAISNTAEKELPQLVKGATSKIDELVASGKDKIHSASKSLEDKVDELSKVGKDKVDDVTNPLKNKVDDLRSKSKNQVDNISKPKPKSRFGKFALGASAIGILGSLFDEAQNDLYKDGKGIGLSESQDGASRKKIWPTNFYNKDNLLNSEQCDAIDTLALFGPDDLPDEFVNTLREFGSVDEDELECASIRYKQVFAYWDGVVQLGFREAYAKQMSRGNIQYDLIDTDEPSSTLYEKKADSIDRVGNVEEK